MALLAEPRRRQKYSIDPRGLNWSKDEEKFGHKMLEKMGWTKGKGLGANEDGNPDHITVKHKADTKGVGCTKKHADNWLAHQDDFNSLLSALSEDHGPDTTEDSRASSVSAQNLEEKAQQQKSRVHYKKFTKGKDLSRYGSTDLDSILGKRKSASAPVTPQVQSEANSDTEEQKDDTASNPEEDKGDKTGSLFGVTTIINTTSIVDYFAKKMAALKESRMKKNGADGQCADPDVQREESSTPIVETASVDSVDYSREQPKKKKKSRKIKKNICTETCSEDSTEMEKQSGEKTSTEVITQDVETPLEGRQKSNKSKKNKLSQEEDLSTEIGSHNSPDVETRLEVGKKSKESRKRKREEARYSNASREEDVTNEADNSKEQKKNPPRKKRTKSNGVDLEESQPTDVEPPAEIKKTKKSKKEKCEKTVNCLDVGSISSETQEIDQVNTGENNSSKKSKKKRKPCTKGSDYCADGSELLEDNVASQSSKEKKPRKLDNTKAFVTSTESVSPGTKTDQVKPDIDSPEGKQQTVKQKLKRKKNKKEMNRKRRKQDLEKLEKHGKGHGFVGSNLDDIDGYGGGFVVQYPWAHKN